MYIHVCDICKKNSVDVKIKYKYKAKRFWESWHGYEWEKIELCQECLDKIIKAESEVQDADSD